MGAVIGGWLASAEPMTLNLLSHARRRIDARFVAREAVMIYILLWLLGVPLSIILILMLLGIR